MPRPGALDVASVTWGVKGADWPSSQPIAHLGRTPFGVWVGTAFIRHLVLRKRTHVPVLGGLGSGGGR